MVLFNVYDGLQIIFPDMKKKTVTDLFIFMSIAKECYQSLVTLAKLLIFNVFKQKLFYEKIIAIFLVWLPTTIPIESKQSQEQTCFF